MISLDLRAGTRVCGVCRRVRPSRPIEAFRGCRMGSGETRIGGRRSASTAEPLHKGLRKRDPKQPKREQRKQGMGGGAKRCGLEDEKTREEDFEDATPHTDRMSVRFKVGSQRFLKKKKKKKENCSKPYVRTFHPSVKEKTRSWTVDRKAWGGNSEPVRYSGNAEILRDREFKNPPPPGEVEIPS
ncbi:hypothetical protein B0H19DRAFT_1352625 [Mycena capillaripes]|nr:hypothetical protein B0H19DRAFT_1352625 [Mycena capillaripes]